MVVEEAAPIRAAVAEFLRNSGLRVLEAASGIEADAILSADMSVDVVCLHMQSKRCRTDLLIVGSVARPVYCRWMRRRFTRCFW